MKQYTFILKDPNREFPITHRFKSGSVVSATNSIMRNKKFSGFTIVDAYCGSKSGKITNVGYISYEYLCGKVVEEPAPSTDEPAQATEFDELLGEVDKQCCKKDVSHAE